MAEPRDWAERLESTAELPSGNTERFAGYGIMSLPFAGGDVLALRRFPASSLGAPMTSIWHRSPGGEWEFFSDTPPLRACPRYFGSAGTRAKVAPIHLTWSSDRDLCVTVRGARTVEWEVALTPTPATRLLNSTGSLLPDALWRQPWLLAMMGRLAGPLLNAGRLRLQGRTISQQWFTVNPRLIWAVSRSHATVDGRDLGLPAPLSQQARLGDFWIPQRGLFAVGQAFFEPFDEARHLVPALRYEPAAAVI